MRGFSSKHSKAQSTDIGTVLGLKSHTDGYFTVVIFAGTMVMCVHSTNLRFINMLIYDDTHIHTLDAMSLCGN